VLLLRPCLAARSGTLFGAQTQLNLPREQAERLAGRIEHDRDASLLWLVLRDARRCIVPNQPRGSDDWRGDALGAGREVRVPAAHGAGVPNRRKAEVERGLVWVRCDADVLPVEDVLAQFFIPVRRRR
jgi:hypothetical protein